MITGSGGAAGLRRGAGHCGGSFQAMPLRTNKIAFTPHTIDGAPVQLEMEKAFSQLGNGGNAMKTQRKH